MLRRSHLTAAPALLLAACASAPEHLQRVALDHGFVPLTLAGEGFMLASHYKPPTRDDGSLHVYLEGDGTPWVTPESIADDPTPHNPLALRLMARDPAESLYLGRPCYNGHARDAGCSPALWTQARYGKQVLDAMADGLGTFLKSRRRTSIVLIGHSGGGILALELARRFPQTRLVVTVAAPLDINLWTDFHGYSRMKGSANPADDPPTTFSEVHYFGKNDERVPPELFRQALARRLKARAVVMEGFGHSCCWEDVWPGVVAEFGSTAKGL